MPGWLARAGEALRIGADRADLWPAGTLAWLAYVGWLPLLLVIAPVDADAIEAFGVSVYLSQSFPLNVILLAAALVVGFAALCLLAAAAGVSLLELAVPGVRAPSRSRTTLSAFAIVLLASLPVVAVLLMAAYGAIAIAPSEYLSGDLHTPVLLRIAAHVLPQLAAAAAVLILVQALAGVALHDLVTVPGRSAIAALGAAIREMRRRPLGTIGLALVGTLVDAALLIFNVALLGVLWGPIAIGLGDGLVSRPSTILLLLGFVAIWLGLLLAAGALHVAVSAWWALQLGERWQAPVSDPPGTVAGSQAGGPQ
ncbi:MAG TPA: hypothetical protein VFJ03_01865 [Candidatus Limnocylindria bacterium]|nr:hypothetical protein [Candidatus Limnocylindria bacterium]